MRPSSTYSAAVSPGGSTGCCGTAATSRAQRRRDMSARWQPRTATVRAKTDCELYGLNRADAARVLRRNRQILMLLRDRMHERAQDAIAAHRSYMEARTTLSFV